MYGTVEYQAFERSCKAGRFDEPETEQCAHIFGCQSEGTVRCDCGEMICREHITRCPDCNIQVCQGGCSIVSADDQIRRCYGCHQERKG